MKRRPPVYDPGGAARVGGRLTSPGVAVIYAAEHWSTAVLEVLVHRGRLALPGAHHGVEIRIPDDLPVERFDPVANRGWQLEGSDVARRYGDRWFRERRTAVLVVPSVPGQPFEWNYVINPAHADARRIEPGEAFDVVWDGRLFGVAGAISRA